MGVRRGGQEGALAPPLPPLADKNSMFFDFFERKWAVLGILKANSMFLPLPPPGKFCPPLEKSLRTPMHEPTIKLKATSLDYNTKIKRPGVNSINIL
jgi:hypothetical protein